MPVRSVITDNEEITCLAFRGYNANMFNFPDGKGASLTEMTNWGTACSSETISMKTSMGLY